MAYRIYKSNGQEVIIQDGVSSEPFSIDFVGRNTVNYGATIATTQLHLLENFANNVAPDDPTLGQLWFDTAANALKVRGAYGWGVMVSETPDGDLGTSTDRFRAIYADTYYGMTVGTSTSPFDAVYANNFIGGTFTGTFLGNISSATTASTLATTRIINVTGGAATGAANLLLNSVPTAPWTVDLPLTINKLSIPRNIALTGGVVGNANFDGSADITIPSKAVTLTAGNTTSFAIPPNATNAANAARVFFTTTGNGLLAGSADLLVLNTGGSVLNALEFDKQTATIRHYQAPPSAATWGTPRTLAYVDTGGGTEVIADKLSPGFNIALSGAAAGVSPPTDGTGTVTVNVTSVNDNTKLPLAGGNVTGYINTSSMITYQGGNASFNYGMWNDFGGNLNFSRLIKGTNAFNTSLMTLTDAGTLLSVGNVGAFSDSRLKTNIELIPDAVSKVCSLRGVTYDRIDTKERQTGVIAQELREVLPEAVIDLNDENHTLSVAYGNMAGLFIEAIKELKAEIEDLKAQIKRQH
jgi:hypothetical protein